MKKAPRCNEGRRITVSGSRDSALLVASPSVCGHRPPLRSYQCEAAEHVIAAYHRGETRGLVTLPTGAGKTIAAAEILRRLGGRALVVAHTSVLVTQLREAVSGYLGEPVGLVLNGAIDGSEARIVVASRQSLTSRRLDAVSKAGAFDTLIFDEAHHAAEDSMYSAILDAMQARVPKLFVMGLTATPWRESGRLLFDRWWFSREIADLIPLGVLAPVRHARIELPLKLRAVRLSGRDDRDYGAKTLEPILLHVAQETAARVVPIVANLGHIVIFAVSVKHAQALAAAFERDGVSAAPIWGAMPAGGRDDVLQRWRKGELRVLVNVGIVTEGFDEPRIAAIVFARPTASTLFYVQALGRGLRPAPGKTECLVVDCVGLGDLRDPRQCTLDAIVPEVATLSTGPSSAPPEGRRLIAAPSDDGARFWHNVACDAYALAVDRNEFLFVVRDAATGLYGASYAVRGAVRAQFPPGPFAAVLPALREYLRGRKLVFGKRHAQWRSARITPGQLSALGAIDAALAERAIAERWNRGRASAELTTVYARRLARRLGLLKAEAA